MTDRFDVLASEYFDGDLGPQEAAELAALLRRDPGRKRWFLEMYQQNRLLEVDQGPASEEELSRKILAEIEGGDTGQFVNSVMKTLETPPAPAKRPRPASAPKRAPWKVGAALAAAALLLGLLGWFFTSPSVDAAPVMARVEKVTGDVALAGGRRIRAGEPIPGGETLTLTGPGSAAILSYPDRTRLELGGEASLLLQKDPRDPAAKSLRLERGFLRADVARQPAGLPFLVRSRFAEVRVLGTRFDFWAEAESTRLEVTEGKVRFLRDGDSKGLDVGAGEKAAATSRELVRWVPVCDLAFSQMTALPPTMEALFCSSRVLHTKDRKIESGADRVRFTNGGLVFDPVPTPNRDHGLVVARWKEEIGEDAVLEAVVSAGAPWSLGFALSGDSFEGYRVIFAIRENPGGIMVDTIAPVEFKPLASDPRPIDFAQDHVLRAEKLGKRIRVWLDKELRIDTVLDHPLAPGRLRTFALSNYGESPVVRSLRVWKAVTP